MINFLRGFVFCLGFGKRGFGALLENAVWVCCRYTGTAPLASCEWRGWGSARGRGSPILSWWGPSARICTGHHG